MKLVQCFLNVITASSYFDNSEEHSNTIPLSELIREEKKHLQVFEDSSIFEQKEEHYIFRLTHITDETTRIRICNDLASLAMGCKKYDVAVKYLNISLEINLSENLLALKYRMICYKELKKDELLLSDLVLFENIAHSSENADLIADLKDHIAERRTGEYLATNSLKHSTARFFKFFYPMVFILPDKKDRIAEMIRNEDFASLNNTLETGELDSIYKPKSAYDYFSYKVVKSSLLYLKGFYNESIECLTGSLNTFEIIFMEYLLCLINKDRKSLLHLAQYEDTSNPTLIFYIAKIHLLENNDKEYLRLMKSILHYRFTYYDLLMYYRGRGDVKMFKEIASKALEKFRNDPLFLYVCAEFAIITGDSVYLSETISNMNDDDHRNLFVKAYVQRETSSFESASVLLSIIKKDPTFLPAVFELYKILLENKLYNECSQILKVAISNSSRRRDIYKMIHLYIDVQVKQHLDKHLKQTTIKSILK